MGKVLAVCISEKRGTQKKNVEKVRLIENYGLGETLMREAGIAR